MLHWTHQLRYDGHKKDIVFNDENFWLKAHFPQSKC